MISPCLRPERSVDGPFRLVVAQAVDPLVQEGRPSRRVHPFNPCWGLEMPSTQLMRLYADIP
ncbi:MAG: hypothetical protein DCF23_04700 [Cyanobium sp.]|nr:MAG: hypothetical protein DCF23_04700 [Cyanobium sp.]